MECAWAMLNLVLYFAECAWSSVLHVLLQGMNDRNKPSITTGMPSYTPIAMNWQTLHL